MTWEHLSSDLRIAGLKLLAFIILKILLTLQLYVVERLFVAHWELIVRFGRATQRLLLLPKVLWFVSEEEPGLSRHAIRNSANSLGFSFGVSAVTLFISWANGINVLQDLWAFILGIAVPALSILGVWYVLAAAQRARSMHPAPIDLEKGVEKPFNNLGLDEDGVRIIKEVWTTRHPDILTGAGGGPPDDVTTAETAPYRLIDLSCIESPYAPMEL
ncbi:hypothetical protein F5B18DRAFT_612044 [Nemania serpens]|nr:hypothetical protein F5B18DRAFT_612044 [Nemania serpens]